MSVLFLGSPKSPLAQWLKGSCDVRVTEEPLTSERPELDGVECVVSYGYRHIIGQDILERFPDRVINLHISFLPWNRGADPNFWSFVEDTPKGVTIHYVDEGLDTGDIIAQRRVEFEPTETLRSSYARLHREIQMLFMDVWSDFLAGRAPRHPQRGEGSFHRTRDKEPLLYLLRSGWETPVSVLEEYAAQSGLFRKIWDDEP